MKIVIPVTALAIAMATPAAAENQEVVLGFQPGVVSGEKAVEIVVNGEIRVASSEGAQGFLLLVEYLGETYTCRVTPTGQVLPCHELAW